MDKLKPILSTIILSLSFSLIGCSDNTQTKGTPSLFETKIEAEKQPRISIALELIKWVTNGCLVKVILLMKVKKTASQAMNITIIIRFSNNK